jgi:hypothetical protein
MQLFLPKILILAGFLLCSTLVFAQSSGQFSLPFEEEEIFVTQNISTAFMGTYSHEKLQCAISKNFGTSYLISASTNWQKEEIIWGVLMENDEKVTTTITEYIAGEKFSYQAYVVILHNPIRNHSEEWMLYELDGKYHFGKAEKINAVAANK